jgi:UDP-N-acetylmuramate dehydrogenase
MELQANVTLASFTTLKVGGVATHVAKVSSIAEVEQVRLVALQQDAPVLVLGHGSNVLIGDNGFSGVVLINQIMGRSYVTDAEGTPFATFGAGEDWDACVADTVEHGYWGLENLSHIPGTVGATPIQNVGAYGVEVSERIVSVAAVSLATGEQKVFSAAACQFGYRDSYFKTAAGRNWVITAVTYKLDTSPGSAVLGYADLQTFTETQKTFTALDIRTEIIRIRSAKFPDWQTVGTAGSFFKNPVVTPEALDELLQQFPELPHFSQLDGTVRVPLGWILDKVCGLRGYTDGAVSLSERQALVLLNRGESATAIATFVQHVADVVYQKTKIKIEPEVRFV